MSVFDVPLSFGLGQSQTRLTFRFRFNVETILYGVFPTFVGLQTGLKVKPDKPPVVLRSVPSELRDNSVTMFVHESKLAVPGAAVRRELGRE